MDLKVGDKVTCIDATGYLVEGQAYTVKALFKRGNLLKAITVDECINKKGYSSYLVERFEKIELPSLVTLTSDDMESILDAFIALDYYSEGTYVNMNSYGNVVNKLDRQVNINNN